VGSPALSHLLKSTSGVSLCIGAGPRRLPCKEPRKNVHSQCHPLYLDPGCHLFIPCTNYPAPLSPSSFLLPPQRAPENHAAYLRFRDSRNVDHLLPVAASSAAAASIRLAAAASRCMRSLLMHFKIPQSQPACTSDCDRAGSTRPGNASGAADTISLGPEALTNTNVDFARPVVEKSPGPEAVRLLPPAGLHENPPILHPQQQRLKLDLPAWDKEIERFLLSQLRRTVKLYRRPPQNR
jgi:hypothetical protein